jgi:hypothetical protein
LAPRRALAPEGVHDPIGGEHLVRVEEQEREQGSAAAASERDGAPLVEDLERAQDAELHGGRVAGREATLYAPGRRSQATG